MTRTVDKSEKYKWGCKKKQGEPNVIKLRDDEPFGYYCLDGIFIWKHDENCSIATTF